jgi:hypothetical protein
MSLDAILVRETVEKVLAQGTQLLTQLLAERVMVKHSPAVLDLYSLATAKNGCAWRSHYAF